MSKILLKLSCISDVATKFSNSESFVFVYLQEKKIVTNIFIKPIKYCIIKDIGINAISQYNAL